MVDNYFVMLKIRIKIVHGQLVRGKIEFEFVMWFLLDILIQEIWKPATPLPLVFSFSISSAFLNTPRLCNKFLHSTMGRIIIEAGRSPSKCCKFSRLAYFPSFRRSVTVVDKTRVSWEDCNTEGSTWCDRVERTATGERDQVRPII